MPDKELATRSVFIDTSAYEAKNFQFGQYVLKKLESLLKYEELNLIVTDVTIQEIEKHLREYSSEAVKLVKRFQKEGKFLRNVPELPCHNIFGEITEDMIHSIVTKNFQTFLNTENIETISVSSVDPILIFNKYFAEEAPFGRKGKKSEFPDAFVLEAVNKISEDRSELIYVVSQDKDMKNFCDLHENLVYLEKIDTLIDLTIRNAETLKVPAEFADQVFLHLEANILDEIKARLNNIEFEITDNWDEELSNVDVDSVSIRNRNLLDVDTQHAYYEVEIEVELTAYYSVADYDRSPWDQEDSAYMFVFTNDVVKKHTEKYDFYVELEFIDQIKKNAVILSADFEYQSLTLSDNRSKVISVHENYF